MGPALQGPQHLSTSREHTLSAEHSSKGQCYVLQGGGPVDAALWQQDLGSQQDSDGTAGGLQYLGSIQDGKEVHTLQRP